MIHTLCYALGVIETKKGKGKTLEYPKLNTTTKMETFGKIMLGLILSIPNMLLQGWIFTKIWGWFIVTTFGLQPLSIVQALGIMVFLSYLSIKRDKNIGDDFWREFIETYIFKVLMSLWVLFASWIIFLFM